MPDVLQVILVFAAVFALMGIILKLPDREVDASGKKLKRTKEESFKEAA